MKKCAAILVCISILIACFTTVYAGATYTENGWTINSDGEIIGYAYMNATEVTIPAKVDGIEVRGISDDYKVFGKSLNNIYVDENNNFLSSIDGVLFNKEKTELLICPEARSGSYVVPDCVKKIGAYAFLYSNISELTLSKEVTDIDIYSFYNMPNLNNIFVDVNNKSLSSIGGVLFNKEKTELMKYPEARSGSYTVSNVVTKIGEHAFEFCKVTSVSLPEVLTDIGEYAFSNSEITEIIIPDSVTKINPYVFWFCPNLTNVVLPDSIKSIGCRSFSSCSKLKKIVLPKNLTVIGDEAFYSSAIKEITFPTAPCSIGMRAFEYCTKLEEIVLPQNITYIGSGAFNECWNLNKATFLGFPHLESYIFSGSDLTIYGYNGTEVQSMAQKDGIDYVVIDPEINEVTATLNGDNISVTVDSYFTQGADLFAVSYKNGSVVDTEDITDGTATLSGKADTVKVFCWESLESMTPLCPARDTTVE